MPWKWHCAVCGLAHTKPTSMKRGLDRYVSTWSIHATQTTNNAKEKKFDQLHDYLYRQQCPFGIYEGSNVWVHVDCGSQWVIGACVVGLSDWSVSCAEWIPWWLHCLLALLSSGWLSAPTSPFHKIFLKFCDHWIYPLKSWLLPGAKYLRFMTVVGPPLGPI